MRIEEKNIIISKEEFSRKLGEKRLLYDFLAVECKFYLFSIYFLNLNIKI